MLPAKTLTKQCLVLAAPALGFQDMRASLHGLQAKELINQALAVRPQSFLIDLRSVTKPIYAVRPPSFHEKPRTVRSSLNPAILFKGESFSAVHCRQDQLLIAVRPPSKEPVNLAFHRFSYRLVPLPLTKP